MSAIRHDQVPLLALAPIRNEVSKSKDSISYEVDNTLLRSRIALAIRDPLLQLTDRTPAPLTPRSALRAETLDEAENRAGSIRLSRMNSPSVEKNAQVYEEFFNDSWSFKTYMYESLYGQQGYYTSKADIGYDFGTANTHGSCLARQLVNQAFLMYLKMAEAKDISGEHFDIVECGAGTGAMAYNILNYIEQLANQFPGDENILKFSRAVKYTIGEISPGLREQQSRLNQRFITNGQLQIIPADARKLKESFPKGKFSGVFVSNELPDAFPVHCIHIVNDEVYVLNVIPLVHTEMIKNLPANQQEILKNENLKFRSKYKNLIDLPDLLNNHLLISAKNVYLIDPENRKHVMWKHQYLPLRFYPEIKEFLNKNPIFLEKAKRNRNIYINTDAPKFIEGVSDILGKGFVITVDYGAPFDNDSHESIREYGDEKKRTAHIGPHHDFHNGFQAADLTTNVCYQSLAEASKSLETIGVIFQRELSHTMRDPDQKTFETERIKTQAHLSAYDYDANAFTALIQVKEGTKALYGIPTKMQPTTSQQILSQQLSGNSELAQIENLSRLYANALKTYRKGQDLDSIDAKEYGIFCRELYGEDFELDRTVAEGIVAGVVKGTELQRLLIKATLKALAR